MNGDVDELAARLAEVEADVARLDGEVMDVAATVQGGSGQAGKAASTMYPSLDEWVRTYFAPTFGRPLGGEHRWCPRWREHVEAMERLDALWRSWEALRRDEALGMVTWLTHYLDPQLAALLGRSGPFAQCSLDRHTQQRGLETR